MVQTSRLWGGTTGDAGAISAVEFREIIETVFGATREQMILPDSGAAGELSLFVRPVDPPSRNIEVTAGNAILQGLWYSSTVTETISISQNGNSKPRIDTIVIEWDSDTPDARLFVRQGTPASTPMPPTLRTTGSLIDYPLADISVASNFGSISEANITQRGSNIQNTHLALQLLMNNSGSAIPYGYGVELDPDSDRSIMAATNTEDAAGVAVSDIPNTEWGLVCTLGIVPVFTQGSVARGADLGVANGGQFIAVSEGNYLATAVKERTGSGLVEALVRFTERKAANRVLKITLASQSNSISSTSWRDFVGLSHTFTPTNGNFMVSFNGKGGGSIRLVVNDVTIWEVIGGGGHNTFEVGDRVKIFSGFTGSVIAKMQGLKRGNTNGIVSAGAELIVAEL